MEIHSPRVILHSAVSLGGKIDGFLIDVTTPTNEFVGIYGLSTDGM